MTLDGSRQAASDVLLVRPRAFGPNPQTATTNRFQAEAPAADAATAMLAAREFAATVTALQSAGIRTLVVDDTELPAKPDAIFPNNWVSFHEDGTAILYPLLAENRRAERRQEILDQVVAAGFMLERVIDLRGLESRGLALEGTGSLVLDRLGGTAYAAVSPRTSPGALREFSALSGYDVVAFQAFDNRGVAVYHTNVLMSIGESFALVCTEAIRDGDERHDLLARLRDSRRRVVEISFRQVRAFAGNLLELTAPDGRHVVVLSAAAARSLKPVQRSALEASGPLLPIAIPTIERFGGGSVRCMLAEIFLPRRTDAGAPA